MFSFRYTSGRRRYCRAGWAKS